MLCSVSACVHEHAPPIARGSMVVLLVVLPQCTQYALTIYALTICSHRYQAPEMIRHPRTYTSAVDEWSVGILAFELCTGTHPFAASAAQAIAAQQIGESTHSKMTTEALVSLFSPDPTTNDQPTNYIQTTHKLHTNYIHQNKRYKQKGHRPT